MHLADYYVVTVGVPALAFSEAVATGVCYGASRLARNVREMTGHSPSPFLVVCWAGVTPMLILVTRRCLFRLKTKFAFLPPPLKSNNARARVGTSVRLTECCTVLLGSLRLHLWRLSCIELNCIELYRPAPA